MLSKLFGGKQEEETKQETRNMFCYQCQQTPSGGCTKIGVCGKDEDLASVQDTIIFGLKGVSAYATHARELGYTDPEVDAIIQEGLYSTLTNVNFNLEETIGMAMRVGEATTKVMDLLDEAHTDELGLPEPVEVPQNEIKGKAILVTGHNLRALKKLLEQSEGKGVNIYTHSEMLPAHAYPELNKYDHLAGNVGKSWTDQRKLFAEFPGAILGTTNCVLPIRDGYEDRFFSYQLTGLEGVTKIEYDNFEPLIEKALELPAGNKESAETLMTGFHHSNVLELAPAIIEAVEEGKISRFFVIAGCDTPGSSNDYYRELAKAVPEDCVILTTACGKFNFNDLDFGTVPGTEIPRYLDLGQCNNSGSAVKIALALADAFDCGVNELPLSIVLSWFEQKAVAILLGLYNLGVQDIYVGPTPPEFLSETVVGFLQENFNLQLTGDPQDDLAKMLG
ncbi:hydroxylamine reductase [Fuchsiella alkaliacetigena]|uniref:hydroxylamine reductase n=1 Tax=Fuchsiella alkaliacetigena TaxID=957042 RepID=UPI00200AC222|nr:hydroxylamine reductase [Fuchsiella alkaliacetigena]MCK8824969.1 hydroxylamine reductase [Fuchsiella alkaliacetigena]